MSRPDRDAAEQARAYLARFLRNHAESEHASAAKEYVATLDRRLAHLLYDRARFYDKAGRLESARLAYQELLTSYPSSEWSNAAQQRLTELKQGTENKP